MTGKDTADVRLGSPRGEGQEETQELGLKTQLLPHSGQGTATQKWGAWGRGA